MSPLWRACASASSCECTTSPRGRQRRGVQASLRASLLLCSCCPGLPPSPAQSLLGKDERKGNRTWERRNPTNTRRAHPKNSVIELAAFQPADICCPLCEPSGFETRVVILVNLFRRA
eukprot:jgi/Botrbrau1/13439/Bobra.0082s0043.1